MWQLSPTRNTSRPTYASVLGVNDLSAGTSGATEALASALDHHLAQASETASALPSLAPLAWDII